MKTRFYLFATVVLFSILGFGYSNFKTDNKPVKLKKGNNFIAEWKTVDSLSAKGLPKSALEIVDAIYTDAKSKNNYNQIIKSFIYKMKFKNAVEESAFENSIYDLQKEVATAKYPEKNIMQSMLAEMYWMYYQSNRWKFTNRTQTVGYINNDIKTWDLNKLTSKVLANYNKSLQNSDSLKLTSMTYFSAIVSKGENTGDLRTTLYDFLAQRAITFFKNKEITLSKPADNFQLKEEFYFADAIKFSSSTIKTTDTLSLQFYGIKILQDLTKFRISDKNIAALIDVNLQRLKFVYANSVNTNKDELYKNALESLLKQYNSQTFSTNISSELGTYYNNIGNKYNANDTLSYKYKKHKSIAYKTLTSAVIKYPTSNGAKKCEFTVSNIENKSLSFTTNQVTTPNSNFPVLVSYKNIETIYTKILKIDKADFNKLKNKYYGKDLYEKLINKSKTVSTNKYSLPKNKDYNKHSTELILEPLETGFYIIAMSNSSEFSSKEFLLAYKTITVSNLSYISSNTNNSVEFYILNRTTGKPINNAIVNVYSRKYDYKQRKYTRIKKATKNTNKLGFLSVENISNEYFYIDISYKNDFLSSDNSFYVNNYNNTKKAYTTNHMFTDRAIYRPGQTIYFKGISIKYDGDKRKIITGTTEEVIFYDVNYQKISSLKLTTNEFGTFNGSFEIPTGILNGQMQIQTSNGSVYFRVEEYKRPKFETEILPFNANYRLNDQVKVQGKATSYSGANITDAMVQYRIVRSPKWRYWWWQRSEPSVEIASGTTTSNEKGIYTIKFNAIPDLKYKKEEGVSFNYAIYADVTDINGETHSTSKNITIGYVDLNLSTNIPSSLQKESTDTFKISTTNLNGLKINTKGNIKIYKLKSAKTLKQKRVWAQPDKFLYSAEEWNNLLPNSEYKTINLTNTKIEEQVYSLNFNTKEESELLLPSIVNWETGHYKLIIKAKDAYGIEVDNIQYFTLFSKESKKIPYPQLWWYKPLKVNCEPGETAQILIGSSNKVKILYEIEQKGKSIKKEFIDINNEQKLISIPITEDYRGNITVYFNYIFNNRAYSYTQTIIVPQTNKELDIEFQTFRNKLLPGEKEKWLLTIKGKKGEAVMAEMMAVLYDKSLDQFAKNYWYINLWNSYYAQKNWRAGMFGTANSRIIYNTTKPYPSYPNITYDMLNWFGFNYYSNNYRYNAGFSRSKTDNQIEGSAMFFSEEEETVMNESVPVMPGRDSQSVVTTVDKDNGLSADLEHNQKIELSKKQSSELSKIHARTNFNETAFFYPELRTNSNGDVVIEFTIPESLTTWKMMGLATTKDLKIGYTNNELITQKDLMVVPNAPRFFREGDIIEFPLKISNISTNNLDVRYNIEFYNAITNKVLPLIKDVKKAALSISAGENILVSEYIKIPENVDAIKYRVVAKAGKFSDAEENVIPVLNNRMLVTESMPLPIRGNSTKTFTFAKLKNNKSKTLKNYKYTLEFTSNPAWYAVQSLPYLMEYPYECAEQTFSRFYANSLASHIANSSPKIKAVFDSWKNTQKSEALLSNLEKNKELKALILEETPWVLEGENESERKSRIGLLFNLNKMSNEMASEILKLQNMQTPNGGWPWFNGMRDNRYITQHIVSGLGHLDHLSVKNIKEDSKIWSMTESAVQYLDNRILEDYNNLKRNYSLKEMEADRIGSIQVQYLYARSFFSSVKLYKKNEDAYNYYLNQAKQFWNNKDKYSQGMIALVLHRASDNKTNTQYEIVKSLKENSITNDKIGMYWKSNTSGYYWYQAPVETQALMIEVFDEVTNDQKSVEELKIWLLKQKQTQNWKTTKATSEAIYALLLNGNNLLSSNKLVDIKIGNKKIDPRNIDGVNIEAGTGYFKTSWSGNEITPEMGEITLTKTYKGVAWGAVYWQYFEQLDKITKHKTPLYIEKKLFVEKNTKSGKIIEPIDKNKIKIGDKIIVRIELRVDRDMEYVHMKDMRASSFEPISVISQYKYQDGLGYYQTTKDASTNFFMDYLPKGTYVFEYPLRISHKGDFSNGITTIQCMYAPEFTSHSEGVRVVIE